MAWYHPSDKRRRLTVFSPVVGRTYHGQIRQEENRPNRCCHRHRWRHPPMCCHESCHDSSRQNHLGLGCRSDEHVGPSLSGRVCPSTHQRLDCRSYAADDWHRLHCLYLGRIRIEAYLGCEFFPMALSPGFPDHSFSTASRRIDLASGEPPIPH